MKDTAREKFEQIAAGMFGGNMQRGQYGNLFDRDSHFKDEYRFADVQELWRMWQAAYAAGRAEALKEAAQIALDADTNWDAKEQIRALAKDGQ